MIFKWLTSYALKYLTLCGLVMEYGVINTLVLERSQICVFKTAIFNLVLMIGLVSADLLMMMFSDECHRTSLMISQHCFRQWFGAIRQQVIT